MAQLEKAKAEAIERAKENAATLSRTVLTIAQQAGDDGRLFGSVTSQDIADAIRDARGLKVDRRKINLEEPIKHVGHLHGRRRDRRGRDGLREDHGRRVQVARPREAHRTSSLLNAAGPAAAGVLARARRPGQRSRTPQGRRVAAERRVDRRLRLCHTGTTASHVDTSSSQLPALCGNFACSRSEARC